MEDFSHPFGDAVPGEAVTPTYFDPCEGYTYGAKWRRSSLTGKRVRVDLIQKEKLEMTTAIAERSATLPKDQLELVRRTVAKDATNDELALYLYDCQRRGIHPLDKLLHFTKRGGKYTPVTSIDFMRTQAAMSGEMAGSDDPMFSEVDGKLLSATVTVYRLTSGQRFAYTATARWSEYCPDNAQMWRKMPHTMLGKCAEALALRKAFPQQLAGLYSNEEMDQADVQVLPVARPPAAQAAPARVDPSVGDSDVRRSGAEVLGVAACAPGAIHDDGPDLGTDDDYDDEQERERDWPPGFRLIDDYKLDGDWHQVTWGRDAKGGWAIFKTKLAKIGLEAYNAWTARVPVLLHSKKPPYLDKVERLS